MIKPYQINGFSIYTDSNQVVTAGKKISIEPQTMAVLKVLLEHQGEVISRDELIKEAWKGAIVSDSSVNRTIAQLRKVFGDTAKDSKYIETIAKKGYRLKNHQSTLVTTKRFLKPTFLLFALVAISLITLIAASWFQDKTRFVLSNMLVAKKQLTNEIGGQSEPFFSSDGAYMLYTTKDKQGEQGVSLLSLSNGEVWSSKLNEPHKFVSPIFTIDNQQITLVVNNASSCSIRNIPLNSFKKGNSIGTKLLDCDPRYPPSMIRWQTKDKLLVAEKLSESSPYQINLINTVLGKRVQLTFPKSSSWGDRVFDFNSQTNQIAYIRWSPSIQQVFIRKLDSEELKEISIEDWGIKAVSFDTDGSSLLLVWKDKISKLNMTSNQQQVVLKDKNISYASFTSSSETIAIVKTSSRSHIWQTTISNNQEKQLTRLNSVDFWPIYLHGTDLIAFISDRSGRHQVWTMDRHGLNQKMVTDFKHSLSLNSLSWSESKNQLIAWESEKNQIWKINIHDTSARLLFTSTDKLIIPQFSVAGDVITFGSLKSGDWQIWGIDSKGENLRQMTFSGGYFARLDEQAQTLYFSKYYDKGVWRKNLLLGDVEQIVKGQDTSDYPWWIVNSVKIYVNESRHQSAGIYEYFNNGEQPKLLQETNDLQLGRFDLDSGAKYMVHNQYTENQEEIWLYH